MKMNRANMPEGWVAPAPAWSNEWANENDPIVAGYFAVQGGDTGALDAWAAEALFGDDAPQQVEQGHFVDASGVDNHLYIAYWRLSQYGGWWQQHRGWWEDKARENEPAAYWREILSMPLERTETLHSTPGLHGASLLAEETVGPIEEHGYAGGMRDRVPVSTTVDLRQTVPIDATLEPHARNGKRVLIAPPLNMCIIRSGQNWSNCQGDEESFYLETLQPVLKEGMRFLRDNPVETHCYSMRYVTKTDRHWQPLNESFGLGYATDIFAFEDWARSHPTHLAIFNNFIVMAGRFGENIQLQLWHEVSALDGKHCEFEYIGCNSTTGLLAYT